MARTNQSGSIFGFVVIGGIMALLLIGGVFVVRQTLMSDSDPGISVVEDDDDSESSSDENEGTENEESQSTDEESVVDEQVDETVTTPWPTTSESESAPTVVSTDTLPETGPGGVLLSGFSLGGLVAASLVYRRSRALRSSL